jgi:hypothetical protein
MNISAVRLRAVQLRFRLFDQVKRSGAAVVCGIDEGIAVQQHADEIGMAHQRGDVQGRAALIVTRVHRHRRQRVVPLGRRRELRSLTQRMPRAAIAAWQGGKGHEGSQSGKSSQDQSFPTHPCSVFAARCPAIRPPASDFPRPPPQRRIC